MHYDKGGQILEDGKYMTFELMGQLYAIDINCIKEILNGCGSITPVPEFPEYGRGVMNLRGEIVPVIDIRKRFGKPPLTGVDQICIIVTESRGAAVSEHLGFVVDKVDAVSDFVGSEIVPPPKLAAASNKYITSIYKANGKIILILEPENLLTESMKSAIEVYMEGKDDKKN